MRSTARLWARLAADDSAQASLEYALVLTIIVSIFVLVLKRLLQPFFEKIETVVVKRVEDRFFAGDLHQLKLGR